MRGSIKKRGATWSYVVDCGRDPITCRRRQVYKRRFANRKAAEAALSEALSEMNRGEFVRPNTATLAGYLTQWLDSQADRVLPATIHSYRKIVNGRIVPGIGHAKLSELDAVAIEGWYGRLRRSGGVNGRPLSAKTVACTAGVLHKALSDAVRLQLLRNNPATDARLPKRERPKAAAWTADEAAASLAAVREERLYPMWRLVLAPDYAAANCLGCGGEMSTWPRDGSR